MQHCMNTVDSCQGLVFLALFFVVLHISASECLSAGCQLFLNSTIGLIDSLIGISSRSRV
jgi:hypothetical protein